MMSNLMKLHSICNHACDVELAPRATHFLGFAEDPQSHCAWIIGSFDVIRRLDCGLQVYNGRPDRAAQHLLQHGADHVMELYDFML